MKFYEAIEELNTNVENRMFTVCDGPFAGEKMILSAGEPSWSSKESGFLSSHQTDAISAKNGGITEIDGIKVFAELLGNEKEVVICGAGNVSMPVIDIAKMMGCRVTAIDDREQFIRNALDHGADEVYCMGFKEALDKIPGSSDTFFIIVTRGHRYDSDCLLEIVKKPYAYIGMIGSRRKVSLVRETLAEAGVPQEIIDSVHMPIGLKIGAETPEEIAVSIMAEIIDVKSKKNRGDGIPSDILKALDAADRYPAVMATIISKKGSSPRGAGARMLIRSDGSITGTIGGGLAEARVIERGKEMLTEGNKKSRPCIFYVDMTGQEVEDDGMVCGGAIEVLLEVI